MIPDDFFNTANNWYLKALAFISLSMVGGVLGYIMRTIDTGEKLQPVKIMIQGLSAGFVGFIVLLLCESADLNTKWTGVIVGVFGWMGANATIQILEKVVFKKLGLSAHKQITKDVDNVEPTE